MSELALYSPDNATPTKRHRGMLTVLIVLTICGATYWWQYRLTPDELVFVGRWKSIPSSSKSTSSTTQIFEFHKDRTAHENGRPFRWTAHDGQLNGQMHPTYRQMLWIIWAKLQGDEGMSTYSIGRYEIVNQNKIIVTRPIGSFELDYVWARVVEK